MKTRVLFFGATAELTGERVFEATYIDGITVGSAIIEIVGQFPQLQSQKLLFAVNQEYVEDTLILNEGDELAIFTPVSGG